MNVDLAALRQWVGKSERRTDVATAAPVRALAATLDRNDPDLKVGDALPPLRHWLFHPSVHRHSELGPDGHARRGEFLPPVPLPRRMWAGGRVHFHHPIRIGDSIMRESHVASVDLKRGKSGPLVFVTVHHALSVGGSIAMTEEQDLVYRGVTRQTESQSSGPEVAPEVAHAHWTGTFTPDPVLLFRYSALTFNTHRIHYDYRYTTEVEHQPGLLVHAPLTATILLDFARDHMTGRVVQRYTFRAQRPLYDSSPIEVAATLDADGNTVHVYARTHDEPPAMSASATFF